MPEKRLIEIDDKNHPDGYAFFFCSQVALKERAEIKPHLSHLLIDGQCVYSTNGGTIRRAVLKESYEDGLYRIFNKSKTHIILYLTDHDMSLFPRCDPLLSTEGLQRIDQINIGEYHYFGHAAITKAIEAKEAIDANMLKNAQGVYDLFMKDRMVILDNSEATIALMPIITQQSLPGI